MIRVYGQTINQMKIALLTIAMILAIAFVMNYSGMTSTLGLAFAATGFFFPFFSAFIGWLGVFLSGSDTASNSLFGPMQVVTAQQLGINPVIAGATNSSGGVMGKIDLPTEPDGRRLGHRPGRKGGGHLPDDLQMVGNSGRRRGDTLHDPGPPHTLDRPDGRRRLEDPIRFKVCGPPAPIRYRRTSSIREKFLTAGNPLV